MHGTERRRQKAGNRFGLRGPAINGDADFGRIAFDAEDLDAGEIETDRPRPACWQSANVFAMAAAVRRAFGLNHFSTR